MPECRGYRKRSYIQAEDGNWQSAGENEPADNEIFFAEEEKPRCCQVYLVSPGILILTEPDEPNTALYDQQTMLVEGESFRSLQRGAYMGRVSEAVKPLKHKWTNLHETDQR